jgi:hypothetical protein
MKVMPNVVKGVTTREWIAEMRNLGGLCHVTSIQNYRKIRDCGAIKPNDGTFESKWTPSLSNCFELGAISLFDFKAADLDAILADLEKWKSVITGLSPTAVAILIDPSELPSTPLRYEEIKKRLGAGGIIPDVEVCYPGEIALWGVAATVLLLVYGEVREYEVFHEKSLSDALLRKTQAAHARVIEERISVPHYFDGSIEREKLFIKVYEENNKDTPPRTEAQWADWESKRRYELHQDELRWLKKELDW